MLVAKIAALFMFVSMSFAGTSAPGGSDACGLGWEVTSKKTMSATTTRGTTNAFVPPTFGMTSGTIGCEQHGLVMKDKEQIHYVDANLEHILQDLALQESESLYLEGLAEVMGLKYGEEFRSSLQSHLAELSTLRGNPVLFLEEAKNSLN